MTKIQIIDSEIWPHLWQAKLTKTNYKHSFTVDELGLSFNNFEQYVTSDKDYQNKLIFFFLFDNAYI